MALHIQMSEEALRELRRSALINRLVSFGVCAGLLLLFGGILYFTILIIAGDVPTEFISYTPTADDGPPTTQPVTRELSSKSAATSPSVTPSVIVAQNAVSAVAAPVSIDTTGDISFDDLTVSLDMGSLGDGLGSGGEGLGSSVAGGSTLEGSFYDLKLTRTGAPSKIANVVMKDKTGKRYTRNGKAFPALVIARGSWVGWPGSGGAGSLPEQLPSKQHDVLTVLRKFHDEKWNQQVLAKDYYSPKTKLYASSFYIPFVAASYAPEAYNCSEKVQDGGWICVYQGRVRAPKTGKFRFIGTGDDYLGVRFNNEEVLQAGYLVPALFNPSAPGSSTFHLSGMQKPDAPSRKHWADVKAGRKPGFEGYELIQMEGCDVWNTELGGLTAGKTFSVKEGETYPIQVVISEIPGGAFGCVLLIEDVTNGKSPKGVKYDLFRTNFNMPTKAQFFGVVEKSNFEVHKQMVEQDIKNGKKPETARVKDDLYNNFAAAIEKLSEQMQEGTAAENAKFPQTPWPNSFFARGRPDTVDKIQAPAINDDSLIWTAVP